MINQLPTCELTEIAWDLIARIQETHTGDLVMIVSNGCCDGTAPYLYENYLPPANAYKMLENDQLKIYLSAFMADTSKHIHYQIDAVPDAVNDSLSLESDLGFRFVIHIDMHQ